MRVKERVNVVGRQCVGAQGVVLGSKGSVKPLQIDAPAGVVIERRTNFCLFKSHGAFGMDQQDAEIFAI